MWSDMIIGSVGHTCLLIRFLKVMSVSHCRYINNNDVDNESFIHHTGFVLELEHDGHC